MLGGVLTATAQGQSRFYRLFGASEGLAAPSISGLAQDERGFIWLGTPGGLYRYDSAEMRRVLAPSRDIIYEIAATSDGIAVRLESGAVTLVSAAGAEPLAGPDGAPLTAVRDLCRGGDGALWVLREGKILRRSRGAWRTLAVSWRAEESPRRLHPSPDGALAATERGLWRLREGGASHLVDLELPYAAVEHPAGGWWLLSGNGKLWRWQGGEPVLRFAADARSVDIVRRGEWAWVVTDRYLAGIDAAGVVQARLGPGEVFTGGSLLVDQEGSLWLGSHQGALVFPEPETATFAEAQGYPTSSVRALDLDDDTLWVTNWANAGSIRRDAETWRAAVEPEARGRFCRDPYGGLWSGVPGRGIVRRGERGNWRVAAPGEFLDDCAGDARRGFWLSSAGGLWLLDPATGGLRRVPSPSPEEPYGVSLVDRQGRLWLDRAEWWGRPRVDDHARLCWAPVAQLAAATARWTCLDVPGAVSMEAMVELPSGALWAASKRLGVVRIEPDGPLVLAGNEELSSRQILDLSAAPDGSVWIVGHGILERLREDPRAPAGWRVEERLGGWQGVAASGGGSVVEDTSGAVWIATSSGVARVPLGARRASALPPSVELVEARSADGSLAGSGPYRLPHRSGVSLRFVALSFRDPALVRYQARVGEGAWSEPSASARFDFLRLDAGFYRVEVRASLDGRRWSPSSASYEFRVLPPWYRTWWALALGLALVAALGWAAHRARVAVLLALERQRTRVAMDLHDEMGSGLGSIGILSSLMTQRALDAEEQRRLAQEIATTSRELGGSLSDIVWALRSDAATLEALAARLAESGARLFAGDATVFTSRFPEEWPQRPLSLPVRRNVVLAGLEALHNAARHAHARRVELSLAPRDGGWELAVEDDGVGLPPGVEQTARGMGLASLRRRAAEIGGCIEWQRPEAGGTRVALRFHLP